MNISARPPTLTALHCFVWVARRLGADLSVERLVHDNALAPGEPSPQQLVHIARSVGMRAKAIRLDLPKLLALGEAFPVLARLNDGSTVVVIGVREDNDGSTIGILDPRARSAEVIALKPAGFRLTFGRTSAMIAPSSSATSGTLMSCLVG
jgi:subfamily B ATP-binding cassette protein HlyB/CyaB